MKLQSNDHRELARRLDLFHFRDEAPGMAFWRPNGLLLHKALEDAARQLALAQGYREVRTPQLLRSDVWKSSGHWEHFRHHMFQAPDGNLAAALKPVSCPGHILLLNGRSPSYRELPLRLCEFGVCHRNEPSGTLHGLLRLRQFTQDDGHIFCEQDNAVAEISRFCGAVAPFYRAFGFESVRFALSTRPQARAGDDADWDVAEAALARALEERDIPFEIQPGEGAFYGPKIEFSLDDRAGRAWQCGTIQFDLAMARSFGLRYLDRHGELRRPAMLHRAVFGSVERFMAILLEHHGAALPPWLAPVQAAVLPVGEAQVESARALDRALVERGVRSSVEADGSLARRVALANERGVAFVVVLGDRELRSNRVSVRSPAGHQSLERSRAVEDLERLCAAPAFGA